MQSFETITDTSDHHRVTTNWDEATSTLIGHCLPIVRVERRSEDDVTVIWRNEPTPEQQAKANSLIRGTVPSHAY